jgi:hypothetical protein
VSKNLVSEIKIKFSTAKRNKIQKKEENKNTLINRFNKLRWRESTTVVHPKAIGFHKEAISNTSKLNKRKRKRSLDERRRKVKKKIKNSFQSRLFTTFRFVLFSILSRKTVFLIDCSVSGHDVTAVTTTPHRLFSIN